MAYRIFTSYGQKDAAFKDDLERGFLSPLERDGLIELIHPVPT